MIKNWCFICFSHNCAKINVDSDDDLPLEKILTMHNVFSKNQIHYYYDPSLEKCYNDSKIF